MKDKFLMGLGHISIKNLCLKEGNSNLMAKFLERSPVTQLLWGRVEEKIHWNRLLSVSSRPKVFFILKVGYKSLEVVFRMKDTFLMALRHISIVNLCLKEGNSKLMAKFFKRSRVTQLLWGRVKSLEDGKYQQFTGFRSSYTDDYKTSAKTPANFL